MIHPQSIAVFVRCSQSVSTAVASVFKTSGHSTCFNTFGFKRRSSTSSICGVGVFFLLLTPSLTCNLDSCCLKSGLASAWPLASARQLQQQPCLDLTPLHCKQSLTCVLSLCTAILLNTFHWLTSTSFHRHAFFISYFSPYSSDLT